MAVLGKVQITLAKVADGKDGASGSTMLTTKQYTLQDTEGLTTEALENLADSEWMGEEVVTWSYGKFLYSRYKRYEPASSTHWMSDSLVYWGSGEFFFYRNRQYDLATYTYLGRDTEAEDYFKKRLRFELTATSSTYIVNKRMSGTNTITLRIDEQYYNPDSIAFTKNGDTFTPTQSTSNTDVYTFEVSYSAEPLVLEIKAVPYINGSAIEGVSSTVIISPDNQTDYYQFFGLVTTLPASSGYLVGDSCFFESENCIYVYDGTAWVTLASASIDDSTKMTILGKAEKTAFQYAVDHGLSQDYGYFDTIFTKYVYARNIGAETVTLTGDNGKLVGGDYTTLDSDGYLVNKGAYVDSTGLARFTMAMLNNCYIKGGNIEVLSITGELINDVLSTRQKSTTGTAVSVGSMATQNYYLGSQAKTKLKALIASDNTIYDYSGSYAGKSFTKVVKKTSSMPTAMANYITVTRPFSSISRYKESECLAWTNGRWLYCDLSGHAEMKVSTDGITWTDVSSPIYNNSRSKNYAFGSYSGKFWAYGVFPETVSSYEKFYSSSDGVSWTQVGTLTLPNATSFLTNVYFIVAGDKFFLSSSLNGESYVYVYNNGSWSQFAHTSYGPDGKIAFFADNGIYGFFGGSGTSWHCYTTSGADKSFTTPANTQRVWYNSGYVFACDGSTIYYGAGRPSGTLPSSWTAFIAVSALNMINCTQIWSYYDTSQSALKIYRGISLMQTYALPTDWGVPEGRPDGNKLYFTSSAGAYQVEFSSYNYQNGLNFLNASKFPVAYESQMGDYIQSQTLTLNNGSTSLLNLPSTIPSGMDFYRRIPTLFNETNMYTSINSISVEAYTRFDTSTNSEIYMSAISSAFRVDISPSSFMVDAVQKLNSAWYIKNKTSLSLTFTPNTKAAGVETGDLNPKDANRTIGAVTPYKSIRVKQLLDLYPVGSVYQSIGETDPTTIFGGTWSKITDSTLTGSDGTSYSVHVWRRKE